MPRFESFKCSECDTHFAVDVRAIDESFSDEVFCPLCGAAIEIEDDEDYEDIAQSAD